MYFTYEKIPEKTPRYPWIDLYADVGACMKQCPSCQVQKTKTVNSLCKDTQRKDNLDVRTTPSVTNHCILTAVVPLSKDNLM